MRPGELLRDLRRRGYIATVVEGGRLKVRGPRRPTPELEAGIREHRDALVEMLREDEALARTGIVQSERQVFDLAREHFGLGEQNGAGAA